MANLELIVVALVAFASASRLDITAGSGGTSPRDTTMKATSNASPSAVGPWEPLIATVRAPGERPEAYWEAFAELRLRMEARARKRFLHYANTIGADEFGEVVQKAIFGEDRKRRPRPETLEKWEAMQYPAVLRSLDRKPGVIEFFEWSPDPGETTKAFFDAVLEHRLISACREGKRRLRSSSNDNDDEGGGFDVLSGAVAPVEREYDVLFVPRDAARTLRDVSGFCAVFLHLLEKQPDHPFSESSERLRATGASGLVSCIKRWSRLRDALVGDLERGEKRPRWSRDLAANKDLQFSRAWLATYFAWEGAWAYTEAGEIPDRTEEPAAATRRDQHLSRFRKSFCAAARTGAEVVAHADDPEIARAKQPDGRRRVPLEWDAAAHPTLRPRRGSDDLDP